MITDYRKNRWKEKKNNRNKKNKETKPRGLMKIIIKNILMKEKQHKILKRVRTCYRLSRSCLLYTSLLDI